jgi:hypothetical protein
MLILLMFCFPQQNVKKDRLIAVFNLIHIFVCGKVCVKVKQIKMFIFYCYKNARQIEKHIFIYEIKMLGIKS